MNVFFVFSTILMVSIGIIMYYKIKLKRFFSLLVLPLLLMVLVLTTMKIIKDSTIDFANISLLNILSFANAIVGEIFLFLVAVPFVFVFFMYVMFPILVLFSLIMLVIENFLKLHYRSLILISPLVSMFLFLLLETWRNGIEKMFDFGNFYLIALVFFPMATAIEQFLHHRKKDIYKGNDK